VVLRGSKEPAAHLWTAAGPLPGRQPADAVPWAEALTGTELDSEGVVRWFDAPTWQERRQRLARSPEVPLVGVPTAAFGRAVESGIAAPRAADLQRGSNARFYRAMQKMRFSEKVRTF
jgi:hypothetical protein